MFLYIRIIMLNSQKYKKEVYPDDFTDDDKLEFDLLFEQSKIMFPKLAGEDWLVRAGVIAYMRKNKTGDVEPPSDEEIAKLKNQYISNTSVYHYEEPKESVEIEVK